MNSIKYKVIEFIVTFLYVGKIKYCPGTFGSLCAFPISYLLFYMTGDKSEVLTDFTNFSSSQIINLLLFNIIVVLSLFIVGTYYASLYVKITNRNDPKEIVIDEVVGQMLTNLTCLFCLTNLYNVNIDKILASEFVALIFLFLLPFILFRIFDIFKPWPISWLDQHISGGFGVMIDDVVAALFAFATYSLITFVVFELLCIS